MFGVLAVRNRVLATWAGVLAAVGGVFAVLFADFGSGVLIGAFWFHLSLVDGFDDSTVLLTFRLWQFVSYNLSALPAAVVMLLAGVRAVQTGVFPRWTGVVAIVSALGGLVAVSVLYISGDNAPAVLDVGPFVLSGLWMVATGIAAVVRPAVVTVGAQPA